MKLSDAFILWSQGFQLWNECPRNETRLTARMYDNDRRGKPPIFPIIGTRTFVRSIGQFPPKRQWVPR